MLTQSSAATYFWTLSFTEASSEDVGTAGFLGLSFLVCLVTSLRPEGEFRPLALMYIQAA